MSPKSYISPIYFIQSFRLERTVDWRWLLSYVHSVMMVLSARIAWYFLPAWVACPPLFTLSTPPLELSLPLHPLPSKTSQIKLPVQCVFPHVAPLLSLWSGLSVLQANSKSVTGGIKSTPVQGCRTGPPGRQAKSELTASPSQGL